MKTFGSYIRELRHNAGLTQDALADGIASKAMISQIELGKNHPSDALLSALAKRLQISEEWLRTLRKQDHGQQIHFKEGQHLYEQGHYEQALELFQDCLDDPHPNWGLFDLQHWISRCLRRMGRCQEARDLLEHLVRQSLQDELPAEVVRAYDALGDLALRYEGRPEVALEEWQRALRELEDYPQKTDAAPQAVEICLQLAHIYTMYGETEMALFYYGQSDRWVRSLKKNIVQKKARVQLGYGRVYAQIDIFNKADGYLKRSYSGFQKVKDKLGMLAVSVQMAVLIRKKGDVAAAFQLLAACHDEVESVGDNGLFVEVLLEQARCLQSSGQCELALSVAEHAYQLMTEQRREAELLDMYRLFLQIHKSRGDYVQASFWSHKVGVELERRIHRRGYGKVWEAAEYTMKNLRIP